MKTAGQECADADCTAKSRTRGYCAAHYGRLWHAGAIAPLTVTTHCNKGHEFTPENTRSRTNGGRACRTCEFVRNSGRPKKTKAEGKAAA